MYQTLAIFLPWALWTIYWTATAGGVKSTLKREASLSRRLQSIPMIVGGVLIGLPDIDGKLFAWPAQIDAVQIAGFVLQLVGLGFSVWARRHLGMNWSVSVTIKEDHELIRSGPYALVRHPIYTGCLVALLGGVLIDESWRAALGLALVFASLAYKVRLEETWLTGHFGPSYSQYRRQVAALIPGLY